MSTDKISYLVLEISVLKRFSSAMDHMYSTSGSSASAGASTGPLTVASHRGVDLGPNRMHTRRPIERALPLSPSQVPWLARGSPVRYDDDDAET